MASEFCQELELTICLTRSSTDGSRSTCTINPVVQQLFHREWFKLLLSWKAHCSEKRIVSRRILSIYLKGEKCICFWAQHKGLSSIKINLKHHFSWFCANEDVLISERVHNKCTPGVYISTKNKWTLNQMHTIRLEKTRNLVLVLSTAEDVPMKDLPETLSNRTILQMCNSPTGL